MAIATDSLWEVRSGGSTTGGGFFNPSNANFMTDLAVTGGEGADAAPHVSSATYTFVAGDVGAWVYVKTGTGWNAGVFYKISSVSAGVAVLDAATGNGIVLGGAAGGRTFTATTVQGIGVATPGGNATFGVDYSQQDAAELTATDLACTTPSTTVTSAGAGFRQSFIGNGLKISAMTGAGTLTHWFEIVNYTDASTVVLDKTPAPSANGTAGSFKVGGAMAALGNIGSATAGLGAVAGNVLFVTQGGGAAFSVGASDVFACAGNVTNPIQVIGYSAKRGDAWLGRNTTTDGKIITTNFPSYQYQSTFRLTGASGSFRIYKFINFSGAGAGASVAMLTTGNDDLVFGCVVTNPGTGGGSSGIQGLARAIIANNDVFMTGASGGATGGGLNTQDVDTRFIGNRVQMSQSASTGAAIRFNNLSVDVAVRNILIGNGGLVGISTTATTDVAFFDSNTIVGFVDGIKIFASSTGLQCITNNIITDNSGNAINNNTSGTAAFNAYNRLRDLSTINAGINYTTATSFGNVTTDGAAYSDYVSQAGGDYRLATGSPAIGAAQPASASMGALQKAAGGGGQVSYGSSS